MKWEKSFVLAAVLLSGAAMQSRGAWYGNLGRTLDQGQTALGAVVDFGTRELEPDAGTNSDVDITGLSFRLTHGIGHGIELYGRISPMTLTWDFDNTNFDPSLLMLGAGLQWAPEGQTGPLTFGFGAGLDWGQGDDSGTDIDVMEFSLAGGVGYALQSNLDLYGGLSFLNTDVTLDTGGSETDLKADSPIGLFGGINYRVAPAWAIGAELRLINEQVVSLVGRYSFGASNSTARRRG